MIQKKSIAILGSTGSIGTQALDVIRKYPDYFSVEVLSTNSNTELLKEQIEEFKPEVAVVCDEKKAVELENIFQKSTVKIYKGLEALSQVSMHDSVDIVLSALVGYSGLIPTVNAIKAGKNIALANKETMVVAGDLINRLAHQHKVDILPVDSEHSAIFQCMRGENEKQVEKIYLTASGGPFRNYSEEQLADVTIEQALEHPNWEMGNKITIDSATLMNKGFEAIEAKWFFNLEPGQIDVIIHPQSIIHSIVQFVDGSMKAQMGLPDMKLPILYALTAPDRIKTNFERFDFNKITNFTFEQPNTKKFRNLALAYEAMKAGGNMPCVLNAANEIAVEAFLNEKIGFGKISLVVEETLKKAPFLNAPNLEDYIQTDKEARVIASELIMKKVK